MYAILKFHFKIVFISHATDLTTTRRDQRRSDAFFAQKLASFINIPYICTVKAYYYGTGPSR